MWADRALAAGVILLFFVIARLAGAVFERRSLRQIAILLVVAIAMLIFAISQKPGGYTVESIPEVIIGVVRDLI